MTADQREEYEERAAILEFDAGMSRPEAEQEAMRQLGIVPEDLIEFEAGSIWNRTNNEVVTRNSLSWTA